MKVVQRKKRGSRGGTPWQRLRATSWSDVGTWAVALAVAVGLWLLVNMGERTSERTLRVRLEPENVPAGMVIVIIRRISVTETGISIAFYFMTSCTLVGAATLPFAWKTPDTQGLVLLIASGVFGGLGQVCNTFAYARAQPSLLGPFDYLGLIWAVTLGAAIFDQWPDWTVWVGAVIVVGSGLVIAWRERRLGLQKQRIQSV